MASESQMVRTIKLDTTNLQPAVELLQGLEGVEVVEQSAPQKLRVTYNISKTGWGTLCEHIKSIGAYKQSGMLNRWRDVWREFTEQNMRDNLSHQPACCSKPPAGAGRK
jgi:hypothetical protein